MVGGHQPTETTRQPVTVVLLHDGGRRERLEFGTYREAIDAVKTDGSRATVAKIEAEDGEVVFRSDDMDIGDWENEWKRAKRRMSVDVEDHDCPYDNVGCLADDLCVQCKMDRVQSSF